MFYDEQFEFEHDHLITKIIPHPNLWYSVKRYYYTINQL